eukprot:COSAG02_NODE_5549_length_4236_cov_12.583998_4_plen_50_part_00
MRIGRIRSLQREGDCMDCGCERPLDVINQGGMMVPSIVDADTKSLLGSG